MIDFIGWLSKGAGYFHFLEDCGADPKHTDANWKTFFFNFVTQF